MKIEDVWAGQRVMATFDAELPNHVTLSGISAEGFVTLVDRQADRVTVDVADTVEGVVDVVVSADRLSSLEPPVEEPATVQHLYTIICDYIFQDKADKWHYMGAFQNIAIAQAPGSVPQFFIGLSVMGREGADLIVSIAARDLSWEHLIARAPLPKMLPGGSSSGMVMTIQADGVQFPRVGPYGVLLKSGPHVIHTLPFGVMTVDQRRPGHVVAG